MKICASSRTGGDPAPDAGALAVEDRHHDAERQQVAGGQVVDRDADAHRPLARQAGDRHQPAHALRDLIHAGAMPVRPGLPEPADAAVDDARVHRLHVVVRHLQPMLHLGAHVLDDDVGGLHQAHERGVAFRRLQVQRHRPLVAVQVLEVEAMAVAGDLLAVGRRRLDLDHIGAPVGEMPHAGGSGARQRQVQHLQPVQRHAASAPGLSMVLSAGLSGIPRLLSVWRRYSAAIGQTLKSAGSRHRHVDAPAVSAIMCCRQSPCGVRSVGRPGRRRRSRPPNVCCQNLSSATAIQQCRRSRPRAVMRTGATTDPRLRADPGLRPAASRPRSRPGSVELRPARCPARRSHAGSCRRTRPRLVCGRWRSCRQDWRRGSVPLAVRTLIAAGRTGSLSVARRYRRWQPVFASLDRITAWQAAACDAVLNVCMQRV